MKLFNQFLILLLEKIDHIILILYYMDNKNICEFAKYFDKKICNNCDNEHCLRCRRKLKFSKKEINEFNEIFDENFDKDIELTERCGMCGFMSCYECFVGCCNICGNNEGCNDDPNRCFNCYGSNIELCCGCMCCIECLIFKNDDDNKIKYCEFHDNYVCGDCNESKNIEHKLLSKCQEPITPAKYIINNKKKCMPELNKYMCFKINNPGYRTPHFF